MATDQPPLRRVQWAARGALLLGVAASVAANILHAQPNWISRGIAAWAPVTLLITIELIAWVPVRAGYLTWIRRATTAAIALIAAWVSYWHMVAVADRYGETGLSVFLLPLSVDGLVVVASICLVELSSRARVVEETEPVRRRVAVVSAPDTQRSPADNEGDNETDVLSGVLSGMKPREAARYAWRHSGTSEKAEVVRWLSEQGRPDARTAVYAVATEFQKDRRPGLVAVNGVER